MYPKHNLSYHDLIVTKCLLMTRANSIIFSSISIGLARLHFSFVLLRPLSFVLCPSLHLELVSNIISRNPYNQNISTTWHPPHNFTQKNSWTLGRVNRRLSPVTNNGYNRLPIFLVHVVLRRKENNKWIEKKYPLCSWWSSCYPHDLLHHKNCLGATMDGENHGVLRMTQGQMEENIVKG